MNIGSTSSLITAETVDLSNCEREAIQIPGTIQSHGAMLVCAGADWRIDHASENTGDVLGVTPAEIIGQSLASVIGTDHVNSLKSALEASLGLMRARIFRLELPNGHEFHIHVTGRSGLNIIEFERVTGHDVSVSPLGLVEALLSRMQSANTVEKHCNFAADGVRRLIGFDRVMVYKFLHDGSGEVICERKRSDLSPFLGLRYPASDIPSQARALYLKSWIRLIADVASKPVPIIPERDPSGQPVDLSLAALRSVSPIHIEYLQNMGVAASMSISIIVGGKLWGLIACHHYTPKIVAADIRAAAELFGQIFSLQIEALEPNDRGDSVRAARSNIDALLANFPNSGSLLDNLSQRLPTLRAIVPCDGIGIWVDGVWVHQGSAPPAREIPGIARFLMDAGSGEMFTTHELSNRVPSAAAYMADASGLLAIPLSRSSRDFLMYFRKEVVHTVNWGGDPNKPVTVGPRGDRLTPRKSFAVWSQTVRGQSTPWSQGDRLAGEALRISLLEVVLRLNEVATRERTLAAERQSLLISELNHRVKNVLALVSSLVSRGRNEGQTLMSFVHGLQGRIKALAFAHDQATKSGAGTLAGLFEAETLPYRQKSVGSIELSGPDVGLDAQAFRFSRLSCMRW